MDSSGADSKAPFATPPHAQPVLSPASALVTGIARPSLRNRLGEDVSGIAGRYRVKGQLSRTAASVVYNAYDEDLGRDVAIKVVPAAHATDPTLRHRLSREAHITAMLDHPNIIPIYDLDLGTDGRLYFTMRLIAGRSLSAVIGGSKTDEGHIETLQGQLAVICSLADALTYAHKHHVVHADITASNILVGQFGEVILADWGQAVLVDGAAGTVSEAQPLATTVDSLYASPEQARGEAATVASDQYGLAAVAFHLIFGRPPLVKVAGTEVLTRKKRGDLDELDASELAKVPAGLVAALRKALSASPVARFANMGEFSAALEPFARLEQAAEAGPSAGAKNAVIALLLVCLGLLGACVIWLLQATSVN